MVSVIVLRRPIVSTAELLCWVEPKRNAGLTELVLAPPA
jgi:hypothetical protein